ncbi:SIR2 family NAD-dependent protein deacylase [Bacillus ndiopicus]|uniref:SIR2 family NAD-dependent protein deacylase n=1 Tax=Bacillus ndiopicus TaxID=1347368 RepID=UPI0005A612F7|nr:NAD-dependent deacylase [Bacillus ndiopicus]
MLEQLQQIKNWLEESRHTVVLTGAGMSTESGLADFRSKSGWWQQIDPRTVATTEALTHNYQLFQQFYSARIHALADITPHEGHRILADWQKRGLVQHIATQNVDGLHTLAGSHNVDELHGSIRSVRCQKCHAAAEMSSFLANEACRCGGRLRPNVVLFGENLPQQAWNSTLSHMKAAQLVIVIGTSLEVYPVSQLPHMTNGKTAYINLEIEQSHFDIMLKEKAGEALKIIDALL